MKKVCTDETGSGQKTKRKNFFEDKVQILQQIPSTKQLKQRNQNIQSA